MSMYDHEIGQYISEDEYRKKFFPKPEDFIERIKTLEKRVDKLEGK